MTGSSPSRPLTARATTRTGAYVGRFAPSPTGPLHLGSLVAAMAASLDARAHGGVLRLRIDDVDTTRIVDGAAEAIVTSLAAHGVRWEGAPDRTTEHADRHAQAFGRLQAAGLVYGCSCTRREIAEAADRAGTPHARHGELRYPGTCRAGLAPGREPRAWRLRVPPGVEAFVDRAAGVVREDVAAEVGDFVLKRADGPWSYHLAIVAVDAAAGITDIVRGADLLGSTARQRVLQRLLELPLPRTLHVPLVLGPDGEKLSKQHGAPALDDARPLPSLHEAARHLRLDVTDVAAPGDARSVDRFWEAATAAWCRRWG